MVHAEKDLKTLDNSKAKLSLDHRVKRISYKKLFGKETVAACFLDTPSIGALLWAKVRRELTSERGEATALGHPSAGTKRGA
jgi:hypothetical protein